MGSGAVVVVVVVVIVVEVKVEVVTLHRYLTSWHHEAEAGHPAGCDACCGCAGAGDRGEKARNSGVGGMSRRRQNVEPIPQRAAKGLSGRHLDRRTFGGLDETPAVVPPPSSGLCMPWNPVADLTQQYGVVCTWCSGRMGCSPRALPNVVRIPSGHDGVRANQDARDPCRLLTRPLQVCPSRLPSGAASSPSVRFLFHTGFSREGCQSCRSPRQASSPDRARLDHAPAPRTECTEAERQQLSFETGLLFIATQLAPRPSSPDHSRCLDRNRISSHPIASHSNFQPTIHTHYRYLLLPPIPLSPACFSRLLFSYHRHLLRVCSSVVHAACWDLMCASLLVPPRSEQEHPRA